MSRASAATGGASAEAIQFHYDVSNDFYRLWLDSTMTYSCALFDDDDPDDDLEHAQCRKLDLHARWANAQGAGRILDVGSGWGSMARRLVEQYEVKQVVGLTLSREQHESTVDMDPRCEIRLENWKDHQPAAPYDGIISIGAFEHFADLTMSPDEKIEAYRHFFQKCRDCLEADGYLSLQTIAYGYLRPDKGSDLFVATQIFPESDLPRLEDIVRAAADLFEISSLRNDRLHYARTCRAWLRGLRAHRERAVELVSADTVRRYERYLRSFCYAFELDAFRLYRLAMRPVMKHGFGDRP